MYKKIGMVPNVQSLVALWSSLEHSFILRNILSKYLLLMNVKSDEKRHSLSCQSHRKESLLFMLVTYLYDDCTMTDFLY